MPLTIRVSDDSPDDRLASARLSAEAFGYAVPSDPAEIDPLDPPGQTMYLAERDGRVVGKARDRHYDSWFGGREVATCGVASVAVSTEARGDGTMRELMPALMRGARERGAVISTLVPTVPGAYRRFGYETIAVSEVARVPTALLARVHEGEGRTRRAVKADMPAVMALYDTWASAQNGPLTRRGPNFPHPERVVDTHHVTLAVDAADEPVGYAIWRHTGGYHDDGLLEVEELLATTRDGYGLLLRALGASYAVAPTTEFTSSGSSGLDLLRLAAPDRPWSITEVDHYMLAVLDVPGAMQARGFPTGQEESVTFAVRGARLDGVDGTYELTVADGRAVCRRSTTTAATTFTPGGLALLYAGAQSCRNIAFVGGVTGTEQSFDTLDRLFGGRQVHIRDSF